MLAVFVYVCVLLLVGGDRRSMITYPSIYSAMMVWTRHGNETHQETSIICLNLAGSAYLLEKKKSKPHLKYIIC
jgi:hypothetical protein